MPIKARNLLPRVPPFLLFLTLVLLTFHIPPFLVSREILPSYHKTSLRKAALDLFARLLDKDPKDFAAAFALAPPRCSHVSAMFSHYAIKRHNPLVPPGDSWRQE